MARARKRIGGFMLKEDPSDRVQHDEDFLSLPLEREIADHIWHKRRVAKVALERLFRGEQNDRVWNQTLWRARELLAEEGHPTRDRDGWIYFTNAKQTERRASSFMRAAYRKIERVVRDTRSAARMTEDPAEKDRLATLELKRANALTSAKSAARTKPKPPGL